MNNNDFVSLIYTAVQKEVVKKLVFSRPSEGEISKISCRLCAHRGRRLFAMEYYLPGNTVSHKNVRENNIREEIIALMENYRQINLITTLGDAEWKQSKNGKTVVLGGDNLMKRMSGEAPKFESAIEALDKKKNYLLSGKEDFLIRLGISSADGRVHDKKQGKFRQINRFLEHIEDIYYRLPKDGEIKIFDLCCGKSYLSFAVYYYLTKVKGREVYLYGVDLKRDVIIWCDALARELNYSKMRFEVGDIIKFNPCEKPDMVISLHACDIATDIVLDTAVRLGAEVILSTPCCHRYLNGKVRADELSFVTKYPHISNKLCEALTDAVRLERLRAGGYNVCALELTDPENTPKNTLLRAIRNEKMSEDEKRRARETYERTLAYLLGDGAEKYLAEIK